jgi:hypothetical protein
VTATNDSAKLNRNWIENERATSVGSYAPRDCRTTSTTSKTALSVPSPAGATMNKRAKRCRDGEDSDRCALVRSSVRAICMACANLCNGFRNTRPYGTSIGSRKRKPTPCFRGRLVSAPIVVGLLICGLWVRFPPGSPSSN